MTRKRFLFILLFIDFALLSGWSLWHVGFIGIFEAGLDNPGSIQIFVDLFIAAGIALGFIWQDAKKKGINAVPYVIVTAALGSFGLIAYMIRRESAPATSKAPEAMA